MGHRILWNGAGQSLDCKSEGQVKGVKKRLEETAMANDDYGYFGKGSTGYAQYMTAFNSNFGGSSGGGGGNHG